MNSLYILCRQVPVCICVHAHLQVSLDKILLCINTFIIINYLDMRQENKADLSARKAMLNMGLVDRVSADNIQATDDSL